MDYWRKGKTVTLKVKVGDRPTSKTKGDTAKPAAPKAAAADALCLKVSEVYEAARGKLDIKGGVQVVQAEGPAAVAVLAAGDIIVTVNDVDITGPEIGRAHV